MHRLFALLGLLLVAAASPSTHAADLIPHNLLAHGDAQNFWVARVDLVPAGRPGTSLARTTIYARQLGEEGQWKPLTGVPVPARVVSLASQNGVAAALLEDGSWMLCYADSSEGPTNGKPLPRPARMLALAGGTNAWWALGVVPGGIAGIPATQPTSAPTRAASATPAATSAPAETRPSENRLVLFSFTGNDWKADGELPEAGDGSPTDVSLAIVDDVPYVADVIPGGARLRHLEGGRWRVDGTWTGLPPLAGIKLMSDASVPLLWVEPLSGEDTLYSMNKSGTVVSHLAPIPDSTPADRTVVIATGKLRSLGIVKGNVAEQDYALPPHLKPDGARFNLGLPQTSAFNMLERVQWFVVTVALVAAFMGSLRQRPMMREGAQRLAGLALAPLGKRFAAGAIDSVLALLAFAYGYFHFGSDAHLSEANKPVVILAVYWASGIFYIVYLTFIETLAGRSLGKILLRLRVVGLDGAPATPGALVMRNVLRIVDVGLWMFPLLIITVFPLRQRAGDVAAGTLVVTEGGASSTEDKSEETTAASNEAQA